MKKTTFQNWFENSGYTQLELSRKLKIGQSTISSDLKSKNGLKKVEKYARLLGLKTINLEGFEYGIYIKIDNAKIT